MTININNNPKFFERSKCLVRDGAEVSVTTNSTPTTYGNDTNENMLSFDRNSKFLNSNSAGNNSFINIVFGEQSNINRIFLLNTNIRTFEIDYITTLPATTDNFTNAYVSTPTIADGNFVNYVGSSIKNANTGVRYFIADTDQEGELIKLRYYWLVAVSATAVDVYWSWSIGGHRTLLERSVNVVTDTINDINNSGLEIIGGDSTIGMTIGDEAYMLPTHDVITGGIFGVTRNTRSNIYIEFDAVDAYGIRIDVTETNPDDNEELYIEQIIATKEYDNSPLDFPCMAMPIDISQDDKIFRSFGSNRIKNRKGREHISMMLDYTQALNPSANDIEMLETLWEERNSFLVWPNGGFDNHRIRAIKGHRPQDVFNVQTIDSLKSEYYKNLYNSGAVIGIPVEEAD